MDFQAIIVYIIGGLLVFYVAWSIIRRIKGKGADPCAGCSGCGAKESFEKKKMKCIKEGRKSDKNCGCGCH